ncbi:MAG: hypothetical protein JRC68_06340 [Deltaproteobacteria bacterium]|nr:hypothetical protein [Deltaproteobacteria bacterium]
MTISSRRHLLPFEEVDKYLVFAKSGADSKGFRGIKPKYLTTAESSGILKRYRLEETAIASYGRYTLLRCKQSHVLLPALREVFEGRGFFTQNMRMLRIKNHLQKS